MAASTVPPETLLLSPATMLTTLRCRIAAWGPVLTAGVRLAVAMALLGAASQVLAQQANVHRWTTGNMPPGAVGQLQLQRGGPLPGYFQPVEIIAPAGTEVALANANQFAAAEPAPLKAGLLIGSVYRLRVTNIPLHLGQELFPTVELINRLYPPVGQELRFTIPIELSSDDLELALQGRFITRVIYLEDPRRALPVAAAANAPNWFDAAPGRDPLAVADALGRPVAILRMGGRLPDAEDLVSPEFLYGSPPWLHFRNTEPAAGPSVVPGAMPAAPAPNGAPMGAPMGAPPGGQPAVPEGPAEKRT